MNKFKIYLVNSNNNNKNNTTGVIENYARSL